jgi:anti-anti-sigma factor
MEIGEERRSGVLVIVPRGRLDSSASAQLEKALLAPVAAGEKRLVIDMAGVEYISSAGLRAFLLLARKTKETSGQLVLAGMSPGVKQVFDLAGFTALFSVEPSAEAALARLGTAA